MIKKIELKNIRSFSYKNIDINNNKVLFIGSNGLGKTTVLESILLSTVAKSHQTNTVEEIINKDAGYGIIKILDDNNEIKVILSKDGKKIIYNKKEYLKLSDYIGLKKVIYFTPNEVELITGAPNKRRNFLNIILSQIDKIYLKDLNMYNNLLKERNLLLKNENIDMNYLKVLTEQLVELDNKIMPKRKNIIAKINQFINKTHNILSDKELIEIKYQPSLEEKDLLKEMEDNLSSDVKTKTTNLGIHRDDFMILINNMEASKYASLGQIRSITLSIQITLCHIFKELFGNYPLFLLDDVFGELDNSRINNLLSVLDELDQVFITTVDIKGIDDKKLEKYQIINIGEEINYG